MKSVTIVILLTQKQETNTAPYQFWSRKQIRSRIPKYALQLDALDPNIQNRNQRRETMTSSLALATISTCFMEVYIVSLTNLFKGILRTKKKSDKHRKKSLATTRMKDVFKKHH